MKKLLTFLLIFPFFISCSSDDDEPAQDYTSFVFFTNEDITYPNCVIGYKNGDIYVKIENIGDLKKGIHSKEVTVNYDEIKSIYFFTDYFGTVRADAVYNLKKNTKNVFEIVPGTKGIEITDKTDPTQYPQ